MGRQIGLQLSSSSVAKRWEGAAPQLSLRLLPPFLHPHHFQHPRRLRRRLSDPPCQYLLDLWIPSTAQLMSGTLGLPIPPPLRAAAAYRATGRSVQLRRWFRKLASRLVSGKEGVVLQSPRQGLSEPRRWLCDVFQAI